MSSLWLKTQLLLMQAVPSSEQELLSYLSWKRPKERMLTPWSGKQAWKYQHQERGGWRLPPKCLSKASPLDRWLCWLLSDKHSHHSIFPAEEKQNGKGRSFSDAFPRKTVFPRTFHKPVLHCTDHTTSSLPYSGCRITATWHWGVVEGFSPCPANIDHPRMHRTRLSLGKWASVVP